MLHDHHSKFSDNYLSSSLTQKKKKNYLSSSSSTYKVHNRSATTGDRETHFLGPSKSITVENFSNHVVSSDLDFPAQAHLDQDGLGVKTIMGGKQFDKYR